MPIQTSRIFTDANGDLSVDPTGTGETKVTSVDVARVDAGTTEDTPLSVAQDGTMRKAELSTLPEVTAAQLINTDLIAVQRDDGDYYYIEADSLAGQPVIDPPNNATLIITPAPGTGSGAAGAPFLISPLVITNPGDSIQTLETFAVTGAPPNGILHITFVENHGGRFLDMVKIADANGDIAPFRLDFVDYPASAFGTTYVAKVRFGMASVYCDWQVGVPFNNLTEFFGSRRSHPCSQRFTPY